MPPDADRLTAEADRLRAEHPASGLGEYYAAWARFLRGDRAGAAEALDRALAVVPDSARFGDTRRGLQAGKADPFTLYLESSVTLHPNL